MFCNIGNKLEFCRDFLFGRDEASAEDSLGPSGRTLWGLYGDRSMGLLSQARVHVALGQISAPFAEWLLELLDITRLVQPDSPSVLSSPLVSWPS